MNSMLHYNTSDARKHLNEIVNKVKYQKVVISLGRHGKAEVLVVPYLKPDEELPISQMNAESESFKFLKDEPDLYTFDDVKKRYV